MSAFRGGDQLSALGDPTRRALVATLASGPESVGALAGRFPISRPAVSQHLRVLKDAGLVRDRAEGTRRLYSLDTTGVAEVRAFLDRFWRADLEDFAAYVDTLLKSEDSLP
jgi:DNA-binding transcriptional ArsR family regulator